MSEKKQQNLTSRKIGGLKLINTGLKGVEITYETTENIDGVFYHSEDSKKSFRPAHRELKALMKEFVTTLIELCGYPDDANKAEFEVTGIKAGDESFLISGKYRCWEDKIIAINTPLIKVVDGYEHFDDVIALVDNVYKEIDFYLSGAKRITKQEVLVDYMKDVRKNEAFNLEDDFSNMNDEELKLMLKEIDKDCGITVHMENGKMVIGASEDEEDSKTVSVTTITSDDEGNEVVETKLIDEEMELDLPVMDVEPQFQSDDETLELP